MQLTPFGAVKTEGGIHRPVRITGTVVTVEYLDKPGESGNVTLDQVAYQASTEDEATTAAELLTKKQA